VTRIDALSQPSASAVSPQPEQSALSLMIKPGDVPPDFTLQADDGKSLKLSDQVGKRIVLYFFPKADTPG
jgi:peroxiredoxin Q/BCP